MHAECGMWDVSYAPHIILYILFQGPVCYVLCAMHNPSLQYVPYRYLIFCVQIITFCALCPIFWIRQVCFCNARSPQQGEMPSCSASEHGTCLSKKTCPLVQHARSRTYLPSYLTLPDLTLPDPTLPYLTFTSPHLTYIYIYIPIPTYPSPPTHPPTYHGYCRT